MTRSTGPALLERPRTDREPAGDADALLPVVPVLPVATGEAPAAETTDADAVEEAPSGRRARWVAVANYPPAPRP